MDAIYTLHYLRLNKSTYVPRLTSEHLIFCGESIHGLTFNRLVLEVT
jgi:hypothetical protein